MANLLRQPNLPRQRRRRSRSQVEPIVMQRMDNIQKYFLARGT